MTRKALDGGCGTRRRDPPTNSQRSMCSWCENQIETETFSVLMHQQKSHGNRGTGCLSSHAPGTTGTDFEADSFRRGDLAPRRRAGASRPVEMSCRRIRVGDYTSSTKLLDQGASHTGEVTGASPLFRRFPLALIFRT
ncbi:hypothetical protein MBOU_42190 [Mycobacterium bourgelatii]|uniref:Uncharacterized protein n=1 Tax=Mycobacterium bourgelatii TaxID=1273442 RepID=A0A7I9YUC8_MYCBU|nr:hypothetical protein MBOU_42190 [Mycobacterium bourgelatii]